ncbi:MAG: hypothetical protein F6J90_01085 [Moorea sp. SIOASIH]|uniref:Tc toxin subunit A-related protein n=1 Tax=Moorena sp. SIOASIH TaxID=2607817 RepID=UPI0013BA42DB|nr:neuraminidase-like domain-containing protein [Moorena sp. SIOASIH]NEO34971.1 hypothetical protein [Moorena sp. SIOASIH]
MSTTETLEKFYQNNPNLDLLDLNLNNTQTLQDLNWPADYDDAQKSASVKELKKARRLLSLHPDVGQTLPKKLPVSERAAATASVFEAPVDAAPVPEAPVDAAPVPEAPVAEATPSVTEATVDAATPSVPEATATVASVTEQPLAEPKQLIGQFDDRLDSAHRVASFSEHHFVQEFGDKFSNEETARLVHRNAASKVARISHLLATARDLTAPHTRLLRTSNISEDISQHFAGLPGYQDIFGSLNYCECKHCKSIFGPAAYFVDLMRIIDKYVTKPNQQTIPEKMQLSDRRPDLEKILLTCENTNHEMPYLQIVNERLEALVKKSLGEPEDIYKVLAQRYYPFALPLQLPLERMRIYLQQLKVELANIYTALPTDESFVAAESLGLSREEWQLLTATDTPDEATLKKYYGVSALNTLSNVEIFRQQTGLKFVELRDLLYQNLSEAEIKAGLNGQFFINHGLSKLLQIKEDEAQTIENLENPALDRINRFLRLAAKLDWTFEELDWVLHCVNQGTPAINEPTLKAIAKTKALQAKLNTSVATVTALLFDLKTYGQGEEDPQSEAPFDLVFNASGINTYHPKDEGSTHYRLNPTYTDDIQQWTIGANDDNNRKLTVWVAAGVGLRQDELVALAKALFDSSHPIPLTVSNLSALYRHAKLASLVSNKRGEQPPIAQYLQLLQQTQKKQLVLSTEDIKTIAETADRLQRSGLNVFEVEYIINGGKPSPSVNPLYRQQDVDRWLQTLPKLVTSNAKEQTDRDKEKSEKLIEQIATLFNSRTPEIEAVLSLLNKNPIDIIPIFLDKSQKDEAKTILENLSRWLVVVRKLRLTVGELGSIKSHPAAYGITNLEQLTLGNVLDIFRFKQLVVEFEDTTGSLIAYLDDIENNRTGTAAEKLSEISGWDKAQSETLLGVLTNSNQIERLYQLQSVFELVAKTGTDVAFLQYLQGLAGKLADTHWDDYQTAADNLLAAVRARYATDNWEKFYAQIDGKEQELKRTALIGTALVELAKNPETKWVKNTRNLYEYLLIDVEMSGCASISYIKEALNATQLYLNRCRQQLEPGIENFEIPDIWWEWLINYRVWEANRKIFLYPENYIDPAYRQSKTTLFKDLESQLKQGNITKEMVGEADKTYLESFAELAKLKYVDAYYCNISDETRDDAPTLFLFARTETEPYTYYYLIQEKEGIWSEWHQIDIPIEAEQITPIYAFSKLFVFWVELKKYDEKNSNEKTVIQKATIKYTFSNFSGGWVQPQTLVQDMVISVDESQYRSSQKTLFPDDFFDTNKVWLQKVYALKIEKNRYFVLGSGANKFEKIVLLYGPMIDTDANYGEISDDAPTATDTTVKQFEDQLYKTVQHLKWTQENNYRGYLPVFNAIAIDDALEVSFLVNPDEFLFLKQESPKSSTFFRPEIDKSSGRLNLISTDSIIHDNYTADGISKPAGVRLPIQLKEDSFVSPDKDVDLDATGSQMIYNQLKDTYGDINPDGTVPSDMDFTLLAKDVNDLLKEQPKLEGKVKHVLRVMYQAYGTPWLSSAMRSQNYKLFTVKGHPAAFVFNGDKESFLLLDDQKKVPSISRALFNSDRIFNSHSFVSKPLDIEVTASETIYRELMNYDDLNEDGRLATFTTLDSLRKDLNEILQDQPHKREWVPGVLNILMHQPIFKEDSFINKATDVDIEKTASETIYKELQNAGYLDENGRLEAEIDFYELTQELRNILTDQPHKENKVRHVVDTLYQSAFPSSLGFFESKDRGYAICEFKFKATRLTTAAVHRLSSTLLTGGIDKLLNLSSQQIPVEAELPFDRFQFSDLRVVAPEAIDGGQVDFAGAYGLYYWELFFHTPLYVANQLNGNQQFRDAEKWFQYIFNPTLPEEPMQEDSFVTPTIGTRDSRRIYEILKNQKIITEDGLVSSTFTKDKDLKRFLGNILNEAQIQSIKNILLNKQLSSQVARFWQFQPFRNHTLESLRGQLQNPDQIAAYNKNPFDPHAIARLRIGAYEKAVVMQYIDNLLDWGDSLFAQYSWESITTATMLYIYAYNLLGERPENLGKCSTDAPASFESIRKKYEDEISQFLISLEDEDSPANSLALVSSPINEVDAYFGIPENEKFLAYWDRVEDRLFKIRHCLNIKGVKQPLPLFQPPIDPAQLVKAAAAGSDVLDFITRGQPEIPHYRFSFTMERAKNFTATVSQLGNALLAALEKKDTESLARLRATQEKNILNITTAIKEKQIEEIQQTIASLQESKSNAQNRQEHYQKLYDENMNEREITDLAMRGAAVISQDVAIAIHGLAIAGYLTPNTFGLANGGMDFGMAINCGAAIADGIAGTLNQGAGMISTRSQYERRREEWELQRDSAAYEIEQVEKSILANEVRVAILQRELEIHQKTIQQADEYEDFLKSKFSNEDLYQWMVGRLSTLYFQTYKMALSMAMAAQITYQNELNRSDVFLDFNYWEDRNKGLLAGEGLMLALQQMEKAYIENSGRSLEIEKTISLLHLDPQKFMEFKWGVNSAKQGELSFELSEKLFDFDFPGHYCRKIKSISISVPAVVGPYQNINATLVQNSNTVVLKPDFKAVQHVLDPRNHQNVPDGSLRENWLRNQQIALSRGIDDAGLFVLDFRDEMYLPFEGTGAVSKWTLSLPPETNRIDFSSISDIIIKVQYTAQDGGSKFANEVKGLLSSESPPYPYTLAKQFDLKQAFPAAWHQFISTPPQSGVQEISFPVTDKRLLPNLKDVTLTEAAVVLQTSESIKVSDKKPTTHFVALQLKGHSEEQVPIKNNFGRIVLSLSGETCKLTFKITNTPTELLDSGQLNPHSLLDLTVILFYQSNVFEKLSS